MEATIVDLINATRYYWLPVAVVLAARGLVYAVKDVFTTKSTKDAKLRA